MTVDPLGIEVRTRQPVDGAGDPVVAAPRDRDRGRVGRHGHRRMDLLRELPQRTFHGERAGRDGGLDGLATFGDQVTNVAREVGVEGKLGGQAKVPGASGLWRDLTDNVNQLAANLTTQVRSIAEVATALRAGKLAATPEVIDVLLPAGDVLVDDGSGLALRPGEHLIRVALRGVDGLAQVLLRLGDGVEGVAHLARRHGT